MPPKELISQASREPGFWIGLALLQSLFMLEHNAICDRLRAEYPSWSDDDLFDHARLVNAALLRIFILMASRRINSDRFFTTDYTPRIYTQACLDWIDDNDMSSVLLRHFPGLLPALRNTKNAFAPWERTGP